MNLPTERRPSRRALLYVLLVCGLAASGLLVAACRGDDVTPPPATIIRATGEVPPSATPGAEATLPMPPTLPPLPTSEGGPEAYPLPPDAIAPETTPSPIAYPGE
ncbi:MAG: hypothetical protein GX557_13940 [Chloroflexi bacterium]|nr:hypothetical protein [Chloroflexota bacterium]